MKNPKHILAFAALALLPSMLLLGLWFFVSPKIRYVDSRLLYEGFDMRQELEGRFQRDFFRERYELDSLSLLVTTMQNRPHRVSMREDAAMDSLAVLVRQLEQRRTDYAQIFEREMSKSNSQITLQLNQYLEEFRKQEGIDLLLGASGSGNILAAGDRYDLTDEALIFVNKKYQGK